jgi:hypothetical protein
MVIVTFDERGAMMINVYLKGTSLYQELSSEGDNIDYVSV